jgi:hypothetical protein
MRLARRRRCRLQQRQVERVNGAPIGDAIELAQRVDCAIRQFAQSHVAPSSHVVDVLLDLRSEFSSEVTRFERPPVEPRSGGART